jgi:hypothetical protein
MAREKHTFWKNERTIFFIAGLDKGHEAGSPAELRFGAQTKTTLFRPTAAQPIGRNGSSDAKSAAKPVFEGGVRSASLLVHVDGNNLRPQTRQNGARLSCRFCDLYKMYL